MMMQFSGYDPHSPTLKCSPMVGECMRTIIDSKYVTAWHDSAAPIFSGDFVRLWIRYPDCEARIIKRLRVSRTGQWFGECSDGYFELGTNVQPFAIEKVVAFDEQPLTSSPPDRSTYRKADDETAAYHAELAKDAIAEWETLGHINGVAFPGLHIVNYYVQDGVRNPQFRREPLPL